MVGPTSIVPYSLDDRYRLVRGRVHLSGLQSLVRLVIDARRRDQENALDTAAFISGYEGSPLAGYDLELARNSALLGEYGIVFRPGVNEEAAATAVAGTQLSATAATPLHDGVLGFWYGKAPGLDRASDALRHANFMGTHQNGGAVAFVGDDPAAKSSSLPSASEQALADLAMPTLYPADQQDILDLGAHAVTLSRSSGLWAALKIATAVADGSSTVHVGPDRAEPVTPDLTVDGREYRHVVTARLLQPTLGPLERDLYTARLELAKRYARLNRLNQITHRGRTDHIGLIAAGKSWLDMRQALAVLGIGDDTLERLGIRLLKVGMVYPLEPDVVREFADGLDEIFVIEEKRPFLETAVKELLYGRPNAPAISGKATPDGARVLLSRHGELDPDQVAEAVAGRLAEHADPPVKPRSDRLSAPAPRRELPLARRTPYFCSGCPHNTSTKPVPGSLLGGGIGCHAMTLLMDPAQVGEVTGLTQMGGEGAQWIGMEPFVADDHLVQNMGDGTFHHSGSLAIRAAVAAGAHITFRLLYNSAVAMTGGQEAVGALPVPELTTLLRSEGVSRIVVTTEDTHRYRKVRLARGTELWPRERMDEALRVLAAEPGVTVLIHDQECAAEKRRKRKRGRLPEPESRVVINERICEGCGDCGQKSNCLSVQPVDTEFGRKTAIDQASCNKDYSCLEGDCPSFLVVRPSSRQRRVTPAELPDDVLPDPPGRVSADRFAIRLTGIGGTGVVTVAQVLAAAATMTGKYVRGLDQTGLAQKGGAVVSDLKISDAAQDIAAKLADQECDLYLGCDLLVAADGANLSVAATNRTVAVVSTSPVPTASMVVDPAVGFPDIDTTEQRIRSATRPDAAVFLDARRLAKALFGDDQHANLLLTGAAYQAGALPLPAEAIERAIELNGVRAQLNIQAFRRGRQAVADPEALRRITRSPQRAPAVTEAGRAVAGQVGAEPGSELERLVHIRTSDLLDYQNRGYAERYAVFVEHVRAAEAEHVGSAYRLTQAVARNLHKLMACKDEYEVARLSLRPELAGEIDAQVGPGARYSWRLHPPLLRALGMRHKITLGPWFAPVFRILRGMRQLRGSALDVFGHTRLRRIERALIEEYRDAVGTVLCRLTRDNLHLAVELAELPDMVRGYENIKLDNVRRYRDRLGELRSAFSAPTADVN